MDCATQCVTYAKPKRLRVIEVDGDGRAKERERGRKIGGEKDRGSEMQR